MAFEWIKDSISMVKEVSAELRLPIWIDTFPPVESAVIDEWEHQTGVSLSPSHRTFFQITNGLNIDYRYVAKKGPGKFVLGGNQMWIIPIEQIIDTTEHEKKWRDEAISDMDRPEDFWKNLIICSYIGDGRYIVLDPDNRSDSTEYRVCDAVNEFWPGCWRRDLVIADSFEEWVKNMFDAMVIRKETPEFWESRIAPLVLPTPLMPSGAEQYDWTEIIAVVDGVTTPSSEEPTHPRINGNYEEILKEKLHGPPPPIFFSERVCSVSVRFEKCLETSEDRNESKYHEE